MYKLKFPSTEEDCKKVLAYHKRIEGSRHYKTPILSNFIETFDGGFITVMIQATKGSRFKVEQFERSLPILTGKPNLMTLRRSAEIVHESSVDARKYSVEQIMDMIIEGQNKIWDAIGQELAKI